MYRVLKFTDLKGDRKSFLEHIQLMKSCPEVKTEDITKDYRKKRRRKR